MSVRTRFIQLHGGYFLHDEQEDIMGLVLLVLLLALLFGGLGFAIHALWIVAVILAIFWLAGFAFRSGEGSWYRW